MLVTDLVVSVPDEAPEIVAEVSIPALRKQGGETKLGFHHETMILPMVGKRQELVIRNVVWKQAGHLFSTETNSEFTPANGWLEDVFSCWGWLRGRCELLVSGSVYVVKFLVDFLQVLLGSPPDGRKTWAIVITTEPRATVVGSSRVKKERSIQN